MENILIVCCAIIFLFSCWNFVCSCTVAICFILNRKNAWPQYATNLQWIVYNMCFMSVVFAMIASSFAFSSSGVHSTTCVTLLYFLVICFLQHSSQSLYVCIQRTYVFLSSPQNMYAKYSTGKKLIIFAVNVCIYIACGIFVFLYFSQQDMNSELQFQYCTFSVYMQSERVLVGIAIAMNAPHLVNVILYGALHYHHVKQSRQSVVPQTILSQGKGSNSIRRVELGMPGLSGKNPTLKQSSSGLTPALYEGQALPSTSKSGQKENIEQNTPGQVLHNENNISVISGKRNEARTSKIVSNKFIVKTKARALREMRVSLVLDAVMPFLLLIVCILRIAANNVFTEAIRDVTLLLTYIIFCLKTAFMVYRYDILREALLKMLRKFLCQRS